MSADEDWLPVHEVARAFPYVENVEAVSLVGLQPLLRLGHIVAPWTHLLMERDGFPRLQHLHLKKIRNRCFESGICKIIVPVEK